MTNIFISLDALWLYFLFFHAIVYIDHKLLKEENNMHAVVFSQLYLIIII